MKTSSALLVLVAVTLGLPAAAAEQDAPAVVTAVYQCRTLTDDTARLACFDKAAAELEQAQNARTLSFGDADDFPRYEGAELNSKIVAVQANQADRYVFTLEDGTRWLQNEWIKFVFEPKIGDSIVVRRGTIGNYRARTRGSTFQVRQVG